MYSKNEILFTLVGAMRSFVLNGSYTLNISTLPELRSFYSSLRDLGYQCQYPDIGTDMRTITGGVYIHKINDSYFLDIVYVNIVRQI